MSESVLVEQREHPRLAPTILRADIEAEGRVRLGYLMNLSLGGAFLAIEEPPAPEENVQVQILFPWGLGECRLEARSVWLQTDEQGRAIGAGLRFVEPPEDARNKLRGYIDRFVELASEITS